MIPGKLKQWIKTQKNRFYYTNQLNILQMKQIKSPVTGGKTKKVGELPVSLILKNIKKQFGFDMADCFDGLTNVSILKCEDTAYMFYHPFPVMDEQAFYNKAGRKGNYYSTFRWEFPIALNYIHPTDKVLEVGCGYGAFLDILAAKNIEHQGLELNQHAVEVATQKGHTVSNLPLHDFCKEHAGEFDDVCLFQVMEHISDIHATFSDLLTIINGGGKLIIAVPNNDAFVTKFDYLKGAGNIPPHHVGLWTKQAFINVGNYFGLKLLTIQEQPLPINLAGHYYTLKLEKAWGKAAPLLVLPTRCFVKPFLKKITQDLLGPSIFVTFEKIR
jgi:2-polyprenyl-3-methyl-5-hydroxy-6-metoxy-1,4-benzoquinol methylase